MVPLDLVNTSSTQGRAVRSIFQEMLFEQDSRHEGWETILQSRLMELAVRVLRLANRRSRNELPVFTPGSESIDRVSLYAQRLKSRFSRQETIAEAARSVGLGRRQFTDLFRKATGQSWRKFIVSLRLKHAAELLLETNRSISAVAFESGFEDLSNFHHSFKAGHGCSPLAYREERRVKLPAKAQWVAGPVAETRSVPGFKFRGMKGWFWTAEQYLEEILVLADLKMNFLMDCYGSMVLSHPGEPLCNEWWKPMSEERKEAYGRIITECRQHGISFCFALSPQFAAPRLLDPSNVADVEAFYQHYAWAQGRGVEWFSICLDITGWGPTGPAACGTAHAALVNAIFGRLKRLNAGAQFLFSPVACWGDGTNLEHRAYLEVLGRELEPEVYIFWNGDSVVTPRITRVAAESFRAIVKHRLFLWDNYPVNDGNPTLHLGPVRGREPDLCEVIDGYLSNPMCTQNQVNRIPLATCADYACNPQAYNPTRSIGQAILRAARTPGGQQVLKELVEAYPGFIVAGGGTGTNPVRNKFENLLAGGHRQEAARELVLQMEDILCRLHQQFPTCYPATRRTIKGDIDWMKQQLARVLTG
jgi:AraC-like DNA-binding protein